MQYIDHPKTGRQAIVNPELAVISGQIKASNIDELRRFRRAFPLNPHTLLNIAKQVHPEWERKGEFTAKDKTDIAFKKLIPACFAPAAAAGWNANLHFHINGAGSYTVAVKNGKVDIQDGAQGSPTSVISMDAATFSSIMRFSALESADQLDDVKIVDDESADAELDDERLALVAGGKGSSACGGEACGGDACGGAACGGAACAGDACGAAACAGDICAGEACGADFSPGPDLGPCALNVIPIIPGI